MIQHPRKRFNGQLIAVPVFRDGRAISLLFPGLAVAIHMVPRVIGSVASGAVVEMLGPSRVYARAQLS